jgi:predicted DNA-binding transcriptional regulator AlpA
MSLERAPVRRGAFAGIGHSGLKDFNRFVDLERAGIFRSRMTLDRAVKRGDFPSGRLMGNIRIWTRAEIEEALARCPTGKLPVRDGKAKRETVSAPEPVKTNP